MKDNLLDEEALRKAAKDQETLLERSDRLAQGKQSEKVSIAANTIECNCSSSGLDNLQTRFARLLAEYTSTQKKLKQRIFKLERQAQLVSAHQQQPNGSISSTNHGQSSHPYNTMSLEEPLSRSASLRLQVQRQISN